MVARKQSKSKLIHAAADLLRRRGYGATSVREIAKHASAPLGSVYHYFPDGKRQFVSEALSLVQSHINERFDTFFAHGSMCGIRAYFDSWREILKATSFEAGCPLIALPLDIQARIDAPEALAQVCEIFDMMQEVMKRALTKDGVNSEKAGEIAIFIISAFEGAVILCRARRDLQALDAVESIIMSVLRVNLIDSD